VKALGKTAETLKSGVEGAGVGAVVGPAVGVTARGGAAAGDWIRERGSDVLQSGGRKALNAFRDKVKGESVLAGIVTTAASGGNLLKGAAATAGTYAAGKAAKYGAKKLEEFGLREIDRVMALPVHYRRIDRIHGERWRRKGSWRYYIRAQPKRPAI
jgi:hypothetical protein